LNLDEKEKIRELSSLSSIQESMNTLISCLNFFLFNFDKLMYSYSLELRTMN